MPNTISTFLSGMYHLAFTKKETGKQMAKIQGEKIKKHTKIVLLELNSRLIQTDISASDYALLLEKAYKLDHLPTNYVDLKAMELLQQTFANVQYTREPTRKIIRTISLPSLEELSPLFLNLPLKSTEPVSDRIRQTTMVEYTQNSLWGQQVYSVLQQVTVAPQKLTIDIPIGISNGAFMDLPQSYYLLKDALK